MLSAEGCHALGAEASGAIRGGVALDEGQCDGRVDVGEDGGGAGPVRVQNGSQLIGELYARGHEVVAPAHEGAQRADLGGLRGQGLEAVAVGAQQIGQQERVGGVALGAVTAVARSGGLHNVGVDRHDRHTGFDQGVDEQPRGPLDGRGGLP